MAASAPARSGRSPVWKPHSSHCATLPHFHQLATAHTRRDSRAGGPLVCGSLPSSAGAETCALQVSGRACLTQSRCPQPSVRTWAHQLFPLAPAVAFFPVHFPRCCFSSVYSPIGVSALVNLSAKFLASAVGLGYLILSLAPCQEKLPYHRGKFGFRSCLLAKGSCLSSFGPAPSSMDSRRGDEGL